MYQIIIELVYSFYLMQLVTALTIFTFVYERHSAICTCSLKFKYKGKLILIGITTLVKFRFTLKTCLDIAFPRERNFREKMVFAYYNNDELYDKVEAVMKLFMEKKKSHNEVLMDIARIKFKPIDRVIKRITLDLKKSEGLAIVIMPFSPQEDRQHLQNVYNNLN